MDGERSEFNRHLGEHLRRIRQTKGLSLLEVEAMSGKEFKASVLGAYERGERAITVARLARLAAVYEVSLPALLPPGGERSTSQAAGDPSTEGVTLDLRRLQDARTAQARALYAYARSLQDLRAEWGSPCVTIRASDLRAVALMLNQPPATLLRHIDEHGLRADTGRIR